MIVLIPLQSETRSLFKELGKSGEGSPEEIERLISEVHILKKEVEQTKTNNKKTNRDRFKIHCVKCCLNELSMYFRLGLTLEKK